LRGFIRRERTCIIDCGNLVFSYERSHKGRLHYQYMTMEFTIGNDYRMKNWATAILSEGKRKTRPSKRCLAARLASESAWNPVVCTFVQLHKQIKVRWSFAHRNKAESQTYMPGRKTLGDAFYNVLRVGDDVQMSISYPSHDPD
jgi:hypothetical protein